MKLFDGLIDHKLENGLRLLLLPETQHELVTYQVWYKVGGRYEQDHNRGLSHFIEHLFFKGSANYKAGEIDRALNEIGAYNNAATSKDYTFYYTLGTTDSFEKMFEIQTDMLLSPRFDPVEVDKERDVVIAEIHRANDNPGSLFYYEMMKQLYPDHPYSQPVLGYEEIIRSIPVEEIQKYFDNYYHPQFMTVVIAGNFNPERARELVEENFGSLKSPDDCMLKSPQRVLHRPAKSILYENTQRNYSSMSWVGPDINNSRDILALDLLSAVLTDSRSSRWKKTLKEDLSLVEGLYFGVHTSMEQGPIVVQSIVKDDQWPQYHDAMAQELQKLRKFYVSREEFHRAREQERIQTSYRMMKMTERAQSLGYYSTFDSLDLCQNYLKLLDQLTIEDMVRVIEKYLQEEPVVVQMLPKESKIELSVVEEHLHQPKVQKIEDLEENTSLIKFASGFELLYTWEPAETICSANLYAKNFGEYLARFGPGVAYMTQRLLSKGTSNHSADSIMEKLDELGARYSTVCSDSQTRKENYRSFLMAPPKQFEESFAIFSEFFTAPVFSQKEMEKVRESILMEIKSLSDSLSSHCMFHLMQNYFQGHPYAIPFLGTRQSIQEINRKDLEEMASVLYNPANLLLAAGGPIPPREFQQIVESKMLAHMGNLELQFEEQRVPSSFTPKLINQVKTATNPKEQAYLMPAYSVPGIKSEEYHVAMITADILGGGMSSRYFRNMRDEKSYGYEIGMRYLPYTNYGVMFSYLGTDPKRMEDASRDFKAEIKSIQNGEIDDAEVNKAVLLGKSKLAFARETMSDRISRYGNFLSKGLDFQFLQDSQKHLEAVSRDRVIEFCQKHLNEPFEQRVCPK